MAHSMHRSRIPVLFACVCAFCAACASDDLIYINEKFDIASTPAAGQSQRSTQHRFRSPRYLVRIGESSPSGDMNDRAVSLIEEGKFPQAVALLESLLADEPAVAQAHNNLGVVYEIFGDRKKAFESYARACDLNPDELRYVKNIRNVGYGRP
jgi:tetratricopeptide (TPR) repeat protein